MLPYRIGCVYWFVNTILYRLSEYRLKSISKFHPTPHGVGSPLEPRRKASPSYLGELNVLAAWPASGKLSRHMDALKGIIIEELLLYSWRSNTHNSAWSKWCGWYVGRHL